LISHIAHRGEDNDTGNKCLNEKMSFVSPNDIANINEMSHHLRFFYGFLTG
jgi:hypothetical protein